MHRVIDGEDRRQQTPLPNRLEDYVSDENPVRVIEVFIDELELAANITHLLASRIVAKAAGVPDWNTVPRQELLDPLGMKGSSYTAAAIAAAANHAKGHHWTPEGTTEVPFTPVFPYALGGTAARPLRHAASPCSLVNAGAATHSRVRCFDRSRRLCRLQLLAMTDQMMAAPSPTAADG